MLAVLRRKARTALRRVRAVAARQRLRALPGQERAFVRRLGSRMPVSTVVDGPLVSIVVVGRDGGSIDPGVRRALDQTTYRPIEILAIEAPPQSRGDAGTRAAAIETAVAGARGELVCLLDPAAEPIRPDWLGHLVELLLGGAVAVGPLIVRAAGRRPVPVDQTEPDLTLLSAGLDLRREGADALPRHIGVGGDPVDHAGRVTPVAGLAMACVIVRRSDLAAAGIPGGYRYDGVASGPAANPYPDMDLSVRLRSAGGTSLLDGRTAIRYHVERGPRLPAQVRPARRSDPVPDRDRDVFLDAWGPRLWREAMLDVVEGRHLWSSRPLTVAVVEAPGGRRILTDGPPPGLDWRIERWTDGLPAPDDAAWAAADVVVAVSPEADLRSIPTGPIRVAWVDGPATDRRDLRSVDIVIAADHDTAARLASSTGKPVAVADLRGPDAGEPLERAIGGWLRARRVGIRIGVTRSAAAENWGDYHFARAIQRELERDGLPDPDPHPAGVGRAASPRARTSTLHVFGLKPAPTRPSQVNLLWQISHPDLADGPACTTATRRRSSPRTGSRRSWREGPRPRSARSTRRPIPS